MIQQFFRGLEIPNQEVITRQIVEELKAIALDENFTSNFNQKLISLNTMLSSHKKKFTEYIQTMARTDKTWQLWVQFVFQDAMAYVNLFLALRSGKWDVRVASIKSMVALFSAYDHHTYQKIIAQHLADIKRFPKGIIGMFRQGAFVVNVKGRQWHAIALDEAHEMLINRKCKASIGRPSADFIQRRVPYLAYCAKTLDNLTTQLSPIFTLKNKDIMSVFQSTPRDNKNEDCINYQMKCIDKYTLLPNCSKDRGLINPFSQKLATPEQSYDLLHHRTIGQKEYEQYVMAVYFKTPSTHATTRKKKLLTFSERKSTKKRITQLEKDKKLLLSAMKKKMSYSRRTGAPIDGPLEQLIEYPMAISDSEGRPIKGQKSNITKVDETRYKSLNPPVFSSDLPWVPETALLEGMMIINTTPLGTHKTLKDYSTFLMSRFILVHLNRGTKEVHVIFDSPGQLPNTPKQFEQQRRDNHSKVAVNHCCADLHITTTINSAKWRETFINCRTCKRNLVIFIANYFLQNIGAYLKQSHTVYVVGANDEGIAWFVRGSEAPQPDPAYHSNAEETDTRVWLHAERTEHSKVLVESCDTDVYHIGMTTITNLQKEIVVKISKLNSRQLKVLNLSQLLKAFSNDPDLVSINPTIIPQVIQTLYTVSGCDYISFFSQIGKASFLSSFFQYASFITSADDPDTPGTLADTSFLNDKYKLGYLAFLRLIGVVYFKKHLDVESPITHFRKFTASTHTPLEQHFSWLEAIRDSIWDRIAFENQMIPSNDALHLHWKRTCWVLHMWQQATVNTIRVLPLTDYGWRVTDGILGVLWDTDDNVEAVRSRVQLLLRGCKCKTGCKTRHCKCIKSDRLCSAGCQCQNCTNLANSQHQLSKDISDLVTEDVLHDIPEDEDTDELMDLVFGPSDFVRVLMNNISTQKMMKLCSAGSQVTEVNKYCI